MISFIRYTRCFRQRAVRARWALLPVIVATLGAVPYSQPAADGERSSFVVIVHPTTSADGIERADLSRIFLKKLGRWPGSTVVIPVDLHPQAPQRADFSKRVHGKSVAAVRAFWQQQIFSGRDVPPMEKSTAAEVIAFVRDNPGSIGYVAVGQSLNGVKVLAVEEGS